MKIGNYEVEYIESSHTYLVNGIIVPSVTQIMKTRFGGKYTGIDSAVLNEAAARGTAMHEAIQAYAERLEDDGSKEVHNYRFLMNANGLKFVSSEKTIIVDYKGKPYCAGRLDMVVSKDDKIGIIDFKRTATLDKNYLAVQLNLYRQGYISTYGAEIAFLGAMHLKDDVRKYVSIDINPLLSQGMIEEYAAAKEPLEALPF